MVDDGCDGFCQTVQLQCRLFQCRLCSIDSKRVPLLTTMSEIFRFNLKVSVAARYWLSNSFKFQWLCQVSCCGTFSETCLLLCTCFSMTVGGTAIAISLAIVTHRQTCQLTDHRSSLHRRFFSSAIWRSEEFHRAPLRPFPACFLSQTRPFSSALVIFQDDRPKNIEPRTSGSQ